MSKKLIAVAAAAALALTGLVGVAPAIAAPAFTFSDGLIGGSSTGTSAATPAETNVVSTNEVDVSDDTGVKVSVTGLLTGDVVRITSTGSVKLLEAEQEPASANLNVTTIGSQLIEKTRTSEAVLDVFAFTTSTTAGTVVLSVVRTGLSSTSTLHLEGVAGKAYNLVLVSGMPSTLASGATSVVTFKATDSLGNAVETLSAASLEDANITKSAATATSGVMGTVTYNSTEKAYKSTLTSGSADAFLASLTLDTGFSPDVVGFAKAKRSIVGIVNSAAATSAVAAVPAQVTALTAQVTALTAQLANSRGKDVSVTKKKFNALAKRWNSAFPGQKVALKQ